MLVIVEFHGAAHGCQVTLQNGKLGLVSGTAELKVPAGTQNGTRFRLQGKGVPSLRGHGRGDQVVQVYVEVPTKLSGAQKDKLKEFVEICDDSSYPKLKDFLNKAKKFFSS